MSENAKQTDAGAEQYIVLGLYFWGKGATPEAAHRNARKANGGKYAAYKLYRCSPDAHVDDCGAIHYPANTTLELVEEKKSR
jgi:hypothetical protein